jgi:hypothetical protein
VESLERLAQEKSSLQQEMSQAKASLEQLTVSKKEMESQVVVEPVNSDLVFSHSFLNLI